jgi:hypothetical protein
MLRKALLLLSILCMALCAVVGKVSKQEATEADKQADLRSVTCKELLDEDLEQTQRLSIEGFVKGRHLAIVDVQQDGNWESVCIPLFPSKNIKINHGYRAVLVCFRGIKNQQELDAALEDQVEASYWPHEQELSPHIHSQLAQKYKRLDLNNCPILIHGNWQNPVLGVQTLAFSWMLGYGAAGVFVLTLLSYIFTMLIKPKTQKEDAEPPRTNRAGLPIGRKPSTSA